MNGCRRRLTTVDDADTIRERYLEAEGLASYLHPHLGQRDIRRSLDDIPVLLDQIERLRDERTHVVAYLRGYAALSVSLTERIAVVELADRIERGEHVEAARLKTRLTEPAPGGTEGGNSVS